jgi:localization factor PodJL
MASEASWQSSNAGGGSTAFSTEQPMDQRTVESLLRRLVERVEDSERRYGEALDELHTRLDKLSQTTEAARDTGAPENSDTFDRLHAQVSDLARRLEQDTSTPLDDFERLGKALSGALHGDLESDFDDDGAYPAPEPFGYTPEPSPFAKAAMSGDYSGEPAPDAATRTGYPDFGYGAAESAQPAWREPQTGGTGDLDKRLVEMAQRLEESIGTAMPTGAIEALNTRLDEIGGQLSQALETAPTRDALEHVERQISEMGQQVSRAEQQLGKVAGIEAHLIKLIARLDEKADAPAPQADPAQLEEVANKAAEGAARLVAADTQKTNERLDAMHRDLTAMSDKGRESGDRLVSTLEAVHESLKQLVQQVERGSALQAKPRPPFVERARQADAKSSQPQAKPTMQQPRPSAPAAGGQPAGEAAKAKAPAPVPQSPSIEPAKATAAPQAPAKTEQAAAAPTRERTLRDRLGAAIPDFKETEAETETPPPFGRAKRLASDDEAVDLDAAMPSQGDGGASSIRSRLGMGLDAEPDAPDDLVAAARRAAQAAALRAEGRGGRRSSNPLPGSAAEQPGRRKRSFLIIAAAVLLVLSALLLYSRLGSRPEPAAPEIEQITPAPSEGSGEDMTAPDTDGAAPAAEPEKSGSWEPKPNMNENPSDSAASGATGFTEMAKSSGGRVPPMPASELTPEPQLASLKPSGMAVMPSGVTFSIEDPSFGPTAAHTAKPAQLPLPPEALGPLPLREAAAKGDAAAQYAIATRYAEGVGTKADPKEAVKWLEQAAAAGLAPAQYSLAAMYERGLGVDADLGKARFWYAAAAEKGNVKAMHNLAVSVSGRDGGEPDYTLAVKWYREAASYGLADSQFNLGILAEHGLGMTKNLSEAYKWFSLAASSGDAEAAKRREVIRVQLAPATLAEAEAAVTAWKVKVAPADANEVVEQAAWAATAPATENTALVARAQTLLNGLGYDVGPPDGLIGSRTRTAVKRFQNRNGLAETGEISIPLVTQLERLSS